MAAVKSRNTKPEVFVRKLLFSMGFRYRLYDQKLPGKPDIVLRKYKTVIFVNGCFWHMHRGCSHFKLPTTNTPFWEKKLLQNKLRDASVHQTLLDTGWSVLVVWECACKKSTYLPLQLKIKQLLLDPSPSKYSEIGLDEVRSTPKNP